MTSPDDRCLLAIDIGGTKTALAIADWDQESPDTYLARRRFDTPSTAAETLPELIGAARDLAAGRTVVGIGVSFGGQVRTDGRPRLRSLVISGWDRVDLLAELAGAFGDAHVRIANDGEAGARGEFASMTPSHRPRDLAYVTVSTGVGGAFLLNGEPHRGRHGLAAEVGHIPVASTGSCPCGGIGHLEAVASGPAIAQQAMAQLAGDPGLHSTLRAQLRENGTVTGRDIGAAASRGDPLARQILGAAGTLVGRAVGLIALLLDPDTIIIGGGVGQAGESFWRPLRQAARADALHETDIRAASLGPDSALRGAVELARAAEVSGSADDHPHATGTTTCIG